MCGWCCPIRNPGSRNSSCRTHWASCPDQTGRHLRTRPATDRRRAKNRLAERANCYRPGHRCRTEPVGGDRRVHPSQSRCCPASGTSCRSCPARFHPPNSASPPPIDRRARPHLPPGPALRPQGRPGTRQAFPFRPGRPQTGGQ